MKRVTLKKFNNSKEVFTEMDRLLEAFMKAHKRSNKVALVYSEGGSNKKPTYELGAYYDDQDIKELEWFKGNL